MFKLLFTIFLLVSLSGCATVPPPIEKPPAAKPEMPGIYHRVEKSQTLWRIAKAYNMDLEELAQLNHISNTSSIEIGQLIFIPNREAKHPLPAAYVYDDFIWPLKGRIIGSYGQAYSSMINKGINIAPCEDSRVLAARNGRVVFYSDNFAGYGKTVILDHGDGIFSVYARNKEVFIRPGDSVLKGAVIASAGAAGKDSNDYLHFEIREGHLPKNPLFYLPRKN